MNNDMSDLQKRQWTAPTVVRLNIDSTSTGAGLTQELSNPSGFQLCGGGVPNYASNAAPTGGDCNTGGGGS